MSATQTLIRHIRERLTAAGFPTLIVADEAAKSEPARTEHRGTWYLLPSSVRFGYLDLAEDRRRQGFTLVGIWSGTGMMVADQAAKGANAVYQRLTRGALPAGILNLVVPDQDCPLFSDEGLTQVYIPFSVTLQEV